NQFGRQVDIQLKPIHSSKLTVQITPEATATITNGSQIWVLKTPFEDLLFPPGQYHVRVGNFWNKREYDVTLNEVGSALLADDKTEESKAKDPAAPEKK